MRLSLSTVLLTATLAHAFDCALTASSIRYDLTALGGLRTASLMSDTPPTTSEAKVYLNLCGTIGEEEGNEEDRCPGDSRLCLKLINHKSSAPDADRVTAVIPLWSESLSDDKIWTTPMGHKGEEGLKIYVEGAEYAGKRQNLNFTLLCSTEATAPEPTFDSYAPGLLSMEWASPDACPRSDEASGEPVNGGGGSGFWGFIKFLFWVGIIGLVLYFGIGMFYNHQQYSAQGWDLLPHRDFWREFPGLISDLFQHLFAGLRGSGSRGGYSSLG